MKMLRWKCGDTKLDKIISESIRSKDNKSGGNHKESPGKKVEVVWAWDEKIGTLRRKEGNENEGTGEKEERKTREIEQCNGVRQLRWHHLSPQF